MFYFLPLLIQSFNTLCQLAKRKADELEDFSGGKSSRLPVLLN